MFEKLKAWYEKNKDKSFAKDYIRKAVIAGKITEEEYELIVGEPYREHLRILHPEGAVPCLHGRALQPGAGA